MDLIKLLSRKHIYKYIESSYEGQSISNWVIKKVYWWIVGENITINQLIIRKRWKNRFTTEHKWWLN